MQTTAPPSDITHLRAALVALALLLLAGLASLPLMGRFNERHADSMLIKPFPAKNQGEWLQREAFSREGLLPVIGTSELTIEVPNRASEFFADAPTGFQICPIGGPGNRSLLMAEKAAALGNLLQGKRVVIILSSSWFTRPGVDPESYAGNFSPLHAIRLLENESLDPALRLRFTARMSEFPDTLSNRPVLRTYLETLSEEGGWPGFVRAVLRPVLDGERAKLRIEDTFAMASFARGLREEGPVAKQSREIPWDSLIDVAEKTDPAADDTYPPRDYVSTGGDRDEEFVRNVDASREWGDLALLLDTLQHYQSKVLVLATPLDGLNYDKHAISRVARNHYYGNLAAVCASRKFYCESFPNHEYDPGFLIANTSHFTLKGWLYVNRMIDNFWHDRLRLPDSAAAAP